MHAMPMDPQLRGLALMYDRSIAVRKSIDCLASKIQPFHSYLRVMAIFVLKYAVIIYLV